MNAVATKPAKQARTAAARPAPIDGVAEKKPAPGSAAADVEASEPSAATSSACLDAYGCYEQALAVIEMMAHEQQPSSFVFAARNLMRHDFARLVGAFDEGADALNEASSDMFVVSELLAEAAPLLTGRDGSCMWAVHAMVTLSKEVVDGYIRKVEFPGAAS